MALTQHSIAIDWGSTSFRAYLLDQNWQCIDKATSSDGIFTLKATFLEVLKTHCGHWLEQYSVERIIMGGMIGSRNGWVETSYSHCPIAARQHQQQAVRVETDLTCPVYILQGVQGTSPSHYPDVMRGEEIQLFGAIETIGTASAMVCLPGTHSKWVHVESEEIQSFATLMTGELFALVTEHSSISSLIENHTYDKSSFLQGVEDQLNSKAGLLHSLFSVRAKAVSNTLPVESVFAYLSGMIIASEVSTAHDLFALTHKNIIVITDDKFKELYQLTLQIFGLDVTFIDSETAFLNGIKQLIHT